MSRASLLAVALAVSSLFLDGQNLATIHVSQPHVSPPVPNDFLGLSIELSSVGRFFGPAPADNNTALINLVKNLGQGTFRIGGNSQDEYCWSGATPPQPSLCTNTTSLSLPLLQSLFNVSAQTNWPLLIGLNLAQNSGAYALNEVTTGILPAQQAEGGTLFGLELGNEIDLFAPPTRPSPYTVAEQASDVLGFVAALQSNLQTQKILRVAPAYSNYTEFKLQGLLPGFLSDALGPNPASLGLITIHAYPTNVCTAGTTVTAAQLLAPSNVSKVQDGLTYALSQVQPYGLDLQLGETNSVACSGQAGVSNAQASALWGLDHMLNVARLGVRRMNFHMGGTSPYNAVQTTSTGSTFMNQVQPLYYAMYLFQAAKGQSFLPVNINTSANIQAYALSACANCPVYIYVINKDLNAAGPISITVPAPGGNATLLELSALSVNALAADVAIGGVQFNNTTGALNGTPQTSTIAPDQNGVYTFNLDHATAVLLDIPQAQSGPSALSGVISSRTGPATDRLWALTLTNNGSGPADGASITSVQLTQKFGSACSPTLLTPSLPAQAGIIPPAASNTVPLAWNFAGCAATARFSLTFAFSANNGADAGSVTLNNLFP